eukprot:tig00020660_g12520.t1
MRFLRLNLILRWLPQIIGIVGLLLDDAGLSAEQREYLQVAQSSGQALVELIRRNLQRCIVSDPARIRQVLINLVGNSAKFSEGGRITVEVDAEGRPGPDGTALYRVDVTGTPGRPAFRSRSAFSFNF